MRSSVTEQVLFRLNFYNHHRSNRRFSKVQILNVQIYPDPPTERWPVFPTLDQRTLAELVQEELADWGEPSEAIDERRGDHSVDAFDSILLVVLVIQKPHLLARILFFTPAVPE